MGPKAGLWLVRWRNGGANATENNLEADALFCGEWDMPFEVVSPGQSSSQSGDLEREFFSGRSDFLAHVGGNGYSCTRAGWVDEYVWEPARCELATWDASAFCEALGGRSLLFLGDSTMRQVSVAVMNAVHWGTWGGAGCQEQISFGLSDTLIGVALGVNNRGASWTGWVNRTRATGKTRDGQAVGTGPPREPSREEDAVGPGPHIVVGLSSAGPHVEFVPDLERILEQVVDEHRTLYPEVSPVRAGTGSA
ncbi:hypothetical protein T484DRAFT_1858111 [Baffinella frigidus]|nr:hypothetical protein T484DRAFT_1858111 [Cryptophyta sp. CCMP2293]